MLSFVLEGCPELFRELLMLSTPWRIREYTCPISNMVYPGNARTYSCSRTNTRRIPLHFVLRLYMWFSCPKSLQQLRGVACESFSEFDLICVSIKDQVDPDNSCTHTYVRTSVHTFTLCIWYIPGRVTTRAGWDKANYQSPINPL